ncbi:MAG: zinc-ribbon domain containing protein [Thermomicrobiales bacterium]
MGASGLIVRGRLPVEFEDQTLTCRECSQPFTWTAGEQSFYQEKGLTNIPARCPSCRSNRKARLGLQERVQSEVTCAECGQTTTVPFVPRNGNPVYCSRCFERVRASRSVATM